MSSYNLNNSDHLKIVPKFVLICHSGESIDRRTQSKIEIRDRFLHTLVASKNKKKLSPFGVAVCMICVTIMFSCLALVHDCK